MKTKISLLFAITIGISSLFLSSCGNNGKIESQVNADRLQDSITQDSLDRLDTLAADEIPNDASPQQGLEVSEKQGNVDWKAAKASGIVFTYARATYGAATKDNQFATYWPALLSNGIFRGAYHHFKIGDSNANQLANYKKQVTLATGDLAPAIRFDETSIPPNVRVNRPEASKAMQGLLKDFETTFNCKPLVITTTDFADNYLKDTLMKQYKLWIIQPDVEAPKLPGAWYNGRWTVWQYSASGTIPGFPENVARSRYHGTYAELKPELACTLP